MNCTMLRYLWGAIKYTTCHKWYVFIEACKLGIPLRGLLHDWHKFLPSELMPYARHFQGDISKGRDKTGYYKPHATGDKDFEIAWFLHWHRNRHHWQAWVEPRVTKDQVRWYAHAMPDAAWKEMIADWRGAGRAQGTGDAIAWYLANGQRMVLHPHTRQLVEQELGI